MVGDGGPITVAGVSIRKLNAKWVPMAIRETTAKKISSVYGDVFL